MLEHEAPQQARGAGGEVTSLHMLWESWELNYNPKGGTSTQGRDVPATPWACLASPSQLPAGY